MKTMTCSQMGGKCDTAISAETKDEMIGKGMTHLSEAHPEMAADVQAMGPDSPAIVEWQQKFDQEWENTPEDAAAPAAETPAAAEAAPEADAPAAE